MLDEPLVQGSSPLKPGCTLAVLHLSKLVVAGVILNLVLVLLLLLLLFLLLLLMVVIIIISIVIRIIIITSAVIVMSLLLSLLSSAASADAAAGAAAVAAAAACLTAIIPEGCCDHYTGIIPRYPEASEIDITRGTGQVVVTDSRRIYAFAAPLSEVLKLLRRQLSLPRPLDPSV